MARLIQRFLDDRSGATAIEYGLIAAIICLVVITSLLSSLGGTINGTMTNLAGNISSAK